MNQINYFQKSNEVKPNQIQQAQANQIKTKVNWTKPVPVLPGLDTLQRREGSSGGGGGEEGGGRTFSSVQARHLQGLRGHAPASATTTVPATDPDSSPDLALVPTNATTPNPA